MLTPAQKIFQFGRFTLNPNTASLSCVGQEVPLRPKSFDVLLYLARNPGRVVTKDELIQFAWPNIFVTDNSLVQCISDIRVALADDAQAILKTVARRGYLFAATVNETEASPVVVQSGADLPDRGASVPNRPTSKTVLRLPPEYAAMVGVGLAILAVAGAAWWLSAGTDFLNASRFGVGSEAQRNPAIAVLPFVNQSDDPGRDYIAEGLTQDVINALGNFSALTVMSWNAVLPYEGKPTTPKEIGRNLGVRYLVEGSVRQVGGRVRLTAQLVDTMRGQVLWSARFNEAFSDVFALQDKITTQIVGALAIRVTEIEQRRVLAKPTENLEAYDYVLRSRPALQRPTRTNNVEARALLHRAIQIDPNYAAAYAALSETYHIAVSMGWAQSPTAFLNRAEQLANKALSLNEFEVRAHIIIARVHIFHQRFKQAEAELERAAAINPNDAQVLAGRGNILLWLGQTDSAIAALERAQHIDPELNVIDRFALSLAYYLKGRYDAAIEQAELNLQKTAGANFSRVLLAAAYAQQNRGEDAARTVEMIRRVDPAFDPQVFGTKFLKSADLEHLRDGFRKAGLYVPDRADRAHGG